MKIQSILITISTFAILLYSCSSGGQQADPSHEAAAQAASYSPTPRLQHPDWAKNLSIYEANIRQYTPEGTFKAFEAHLDKIKALGTEIIWLMPIHPIGEVNRKGELGSYYAVQDYKDVNPEFGSMEDFRHLVDAIHERGMYIIIDYVPNHTAWDHAWVKEHPEWYMKNGDGEMIPPLGTDWSDVVQLDYEQEGLRDAMVDALRFWVRDLGIDGYRCDVAGYVPTRFWNRVRWELDQIKPVFMLAEWEARDLQMQAFDMTYAWSLWELMHEVGQGEANAAALYHHFYRHILEIPRHNILMNHVENHDKNSWEGTTEGNFGGTLEPFMVMTVAIPGMPLVYNGQEANNQKALEFFERDPIAWKEHPYRKLYGELLQYKKEHNALWNADWGGDFLLIENDKREQVFAFTRNGDGDQVLYIANFSNLPVEATLQGSYWNGSWVSMKTGEQDLLSSATAIKLKPYEWRLYHR